MAGSNEPGPSGLCSSTSRHPQTDGDSWETIQRQKVSSQLAMNKKESCDCFSEFPSAMDFTFHLESAIHLYVNCIMLAKHRLGHPIYIASVLTIWLLPMMS